MDVFFFGLSIIAWKGLSYCKCKQIVEEKPITHTTLECSDDEEGEDCANCPNGMEGSVKAYDRHVVICDTRHDWPKSIDNNKFFPYSVISKLEAKKNEVKIMVTGCRHITDCDEDQVEAIVYPDNIAFRLKEADFDAFADLMTSKNRLKLEDLQSLPFKASKPFTEKLIMVCTHKRDARCQTLGPQIIVEMRRLLKEQNVAERSIAVRQTSHIGGHAFAGTMIVYPQGVWYGKVTAKGAKSLLRAIQEGRQHAKCFRGQAVGKAIEW